jgi:hypothetical protein
MTYNETLFHSQIIFLNQWKQISKTFYNLIPQTALDEYISGCFCENCVSISAYNNLIY